MLCALVSEIALLNYMADWSFFTCAFLIVVEHLNEAAEWSLPERREALFVYSCAHLRL